MRLLVIMLWFALAANATGTEFPYTAYVTSRDAYVRSGPGKSDYPTDRLKPGQEVEVYRHDPGGWYAIRPPEGSFAWVPARHVQPIEGGMGKVSGDRVPARVGSRLSNVRDVIQVRLHRDEIVEILDERDVGGQTWYQIAPPSGEFRWISHDDVDRQPPRSQFDERDVARRADDFRATSYRETADQPRPGWLPRTERGSTTRPASYRGELADMVDRLEEDLSLAVAKEPSTWRFDQLRADVETLIDEVETAAERARVRRVQAKIARFEDIHRRHERINNAQVDTDRPSRQTAAVAERRYAPPARLQPQPATSAAADPAPERSALQGTAPERTSLERSILERSAPPAAAASEYDGTGILRPVISRRRDAPRFALVNRTGDVLSFVTPARGVTLDTLVGRKIGVTGTRGYMREYRRPHVVAEHVALLDGLVQSPRDVRLSSQPAPRSVSRGRY